MNQEEWDSQLIECFFYHKDVRMSRLLGGKNLEEFSGLLRIPRIYDLNKTVPHFISSLIPKLAAILWVTDPSKSPNIVNALKKSKLDTSKHKIGKKEEERQERVLENKQFKVGAFSKGRLRVAASMGNGSDWKTCK